MRENPNFEADFIKKGPSNNRQYFQLIGTNRFAISSGTIIANVKCLEALIKSGHD